MTGAPEGSAGTGRRAPLRRKLLVLLAVLGIALVAAELLVRSLDPVTLGFSYRRGSFTRPPEFVFDPAVNSWGFHDVEPRPPRPRTLRVALLGDSYLAGAYLSIPETFGRRLEAELRARTGRAVEVTSLGKPGWGQREQLAALREHGAAVAPHLVVTLFLTFNDVRNNSDALQALAEEEQANAERVQPTWIKLPASRAPLFLVRGSRLNQLLSHRLALRATRAQDVVPLDYLVYRTDPDEVWRDAWRTTEDLLLETGALAEELGARYAIASASTIHGILGPEEGLELLRRSFPAMRAGSFDLDLPDERLRAFGREHGIPVLATEPALRELARAGEELHWRYDGHWNALGTRRAAELVAGFVEPLLDADE